jgi:uncharacterized iron-regulated protein
MAKIPFHFHVSLLCILLALSCTARDASAYRQALRLHDGKVVPFDEMIDDLKNADIVFVGEVHDSLRDHQAELDVIRALHERGIRFGIGFEMFRADSQRTLDEWSDGKLDKAKFVRVYYDNWRMPWPFYGDIFLYARSHSLPMVGLNVPDAISEKVAAKGFGSLTRDELAQLPPGISCDVDRKYMDFIRRVYKAHGAGTDSFVHFCEAQMLWDKAMAWHLVEFMKKHPGEKMVVLSGIGHAWKRGIPEQVKQGSSYTFRVVLPAVPDTTKRSAITAADADYILVD